MRELKQREGNISEYSSVDGLVGQCKERTGTEISTLKPPTSIFSQGLIRCKEVNVFQKEQNSTKTSSFFFS